MPEEAQKRSTDRNVVHCLRCHKPQENLPVHLARVCMKSSTADERADELQKAKASNRRWIRANRTWDYQQLCEILLDRRSRVGMVKELLRRGFFIKNQPDESELVLDPTDDTATDAANAPHPANSSSSVRMKMKEAGLHGKFPAKAKLLVGFKRYLTESLRVSNCQQQVDSVSRFLRYMQPTGDEPTLDFLSKTSETRDFLRALRHTKMRSATILNYIKSMMRFLGYLKTRLDLQKTDKQLRSNCQTYAGMLKTLRKPVYKIHEKEMGGKRRSQFAEAAPTIADCQKILRATKADFLRIYGNLLMGNEVSNAEKTLYRYYCEAILVFRYHQCPGAVESLTDAEWVERIQHDGRVVTGISIHKTSSKQIATFALTQKEETWFQLYFKHIRPENIRPEKFCNNFFLSSTGEAVNSVSQDMNRFHEIYKLPMLRSHDVRKAVEAAAQTLPAQQKEAITHYMAHSTGVVQKHDRMRQPQFVVDTTVLLDSVAGSASDDENSSPNPNSPETESMECEPLTKDFSAFVARFPVSLNGQPPTKKQRVDAGFPGDRVFYDRWRSSQFALREEYLLSQFPLCRPSAAQVARLIEREGWTANHPKAEDMERLWKPAPKVSTETDEMIIKSVSQQTWKGLAIKQSLGVVATQRFPKGHVVCDYHGRVITAAEGRAMIQDLLLEAGQLFFFKAGQRDLCVDAQTFPCKCHPDTDTFGRRIHRSSKTPNLKPFHCVLKVNGEDRDVILFKALQDISVDTQLKFDS